MTKHILVELSSLSLALIASADAKSDCGASHATAGTATEAAVPAALPTLLEVAQAGGFTTLSAAVEAAGLAETLNGPGPFTVLAPTDEAFAKLPAGTVEALLKDPEALRAILLHHVVAGTVKAANVVKLKSAKTAGGTSLAIAVDKKGVKVAGANVLKTDIAASNGVIHVIDSVLLP
jgi:uncharacterized surface protein with fasciclin (FAS1) repeats